MAVLPAGDPMLVRRTPAHLKRLTFGASQDAEVRLAARSVKANLRASIRIELDSALVAKETAPLINAEIALIGPAAAMNCAAAVAAIAAASPAPLDWGNLRAIERALAAVEAVAGRLKMNTVGGVVVIDDSYNAQPPSVRASLMAAREVAQGLNARLVLALGDMLELGKLSKSAHAEVARQVHALSPAVVVAVGDEMCAAFSAAPLAGGELRCCRDSAEAAALLPSMVRGGDVVLVKGSLGIDMTRIVAALGEALARD